mmetsp:Transcript_30909/g.80862  ORF Transcript_30909/g.80862 Transcript_30909/m.80862 type:complete len:236 (+) Transcript_30909:504-1211(+)
MIGVEPRGQEGTLLSEGLDAPIAVAGDVKALVVINQVDHRVVLVLVAMERHLAVVGRDGHKMLHNPIQRDNREAVLSLLLGEADEVGAHSGPVQQGLCSPPVNCAVVPHHGTGDGVPRSGLCRGGRWPGRRRGGSRATNTSQLSGRSADGRRARESASVPPSRRAEGRCSRLGSFAAASPAAHVPHPVHHVPRHAVALAILRLAAKTMARILPLLLGPSDDDVHIVVNVFGKHNL